MFFNFFYFIYQFYVCKSFYFFNQGILYYYVPSNFSICLRAAYSFIIDDCWST